MSSTTLSPQQEIVDLFFQHGTLLSTEALSLLQDKQRAQALLTALPIPLPPVVTRELVEVFFAPNPIHTNWTNLEPHTDVILAQSAESLLLQIAPHLSLQQASLQKKEERDAIASQREKLNQEYPVRVTFSYRDDTRTWNVQDFVALFHDRYRFLRSILQNRQDLEHAVSISRLTTIQERTAVALIGLVLEKDTTKNNNIILTLEDSTGVIKVLITKNKPVLYMQAKDIVLDEVIGVSGIAGEGVVFAQSLLLPEVPVQKELRKAPDESYAVFLSDIHVGSIKFLPEEFGKFLKWIRGETGTEEQRAIAKKVRYVFIAGDVVDGVGIYQEQESELAIPDIYAQYAEAARLLRQIPPHIKLIICPGNHDAMRLAEPQPEFYKDFSKPLYELPNIITVSNPGIVNIHASNGFPGFDIFLYHGYSFDYYVANVDSIREAGGYDRADLIMKFLLQRRHLAPAHASTQYVPAGKDNLLVERVPDFLISGHIHKAAASTYRNTTMISSSCWQSTTIFQERVGHRPEPARVPLVNLQTRQVKMLRF